MNTEQAIFAQFSSAHESTTNASGAGVEFVNLGAFRHLAKFFDELRKGFFMNRKVDLEKSQAAALIDKTLADYLQATHPTGDRDGRLVWLIRKCEEARSYLIFLEARRTFLAAVEGNGLDAVAARLTGTAV